MRSSCSIDIRGDWQISKMDQFVFSLLLVFSSLTPPVVSFPTGAPASACSTFTPNHGVSAQTSDVPYEIDISVFEQALGGYGYVPSRTYTVSLGPTASDPSVFRGFLIQARSRADDSPIGVFATPPSTGSTYRHSNCNPANAAVTHVDRNDKSSVEISWTAPPAGSGDIYFVFSVVQTQLTFWAGETTITIQERPCDLPFYLNTATNQCVEQCPDFQFGNHITVQCEPLPSNYTLHFNATRYIADIESTFPELEPIIYLRVYFNLTFFQFSPQNPDSLGGLLFINNDVSTGQLFGFLQQSGTTEQQRTITSSQIDTSDSTSGILNDQIVFSAGGSQLPIEQDFEIGMIAISTTQGIPISTEGIRGIVTIRAPLDPCESDPGPCLNGGTCSSNPLQSSTLFNCTCTAGYTGTTCETISDHCMALEPCQNGGTCTDTIDSYTCDCGIEYTGMNCSVSIDHCVNIDCNNGTCVDGIGTFNCECNTGYTGTFCDVNIDDCAPSPCANGTCIDRLPGFECECYVGWTGELCDTDIDYCGLDPSFFGPCDDTGADGCIDGNSTYTCICGRGFTGPNCSMDIDECLAEPCMNGATCDNLPFGNFECMCPNGFTGDTCNVDIDFCTPDTCANGGTCNEGLGPETSCECAPGYTGSNCTTDLSFCTNETCMNGGTCIDGVGDMISCECADGFTGMVCDADDPNFSACGPAVCLNGGTCVEEFGSDFSCDCTDGFNGTFCGNEFCTSGTCLNGGTCLGEGTFASCDCTSEFTGDRCERALPCVSNPCQNGGTCTDISDTDYSCECPSGFTGRNCETMAMVGCRNDNGCPATSYCEISCPSDNYAGPFASLLTETAELTGVSFVTVPASRYPDFSGDVSIFAVFRQEPGNRGYILFYGTSPDNRNLGVFLDGSTTPRIYLYYTSSDNSTKSINVRAPFADGAIHYLVISIDVNPGNARFFLDGAQIGGANQLETPNLQAMVSDSNPASLLVGARLVRHYRFIGEIMDVVVFSRLLTQSNVTQLQDDYSQISNPVGDCTPYLARDAVCPTPTTAPSLLCQSRTQICDPSLRCLPTLNGYTCQPEPVECTSDDECDPLHFCGSALPPHGSNYYDHPGSILEGQAVFLQQTSMGFNGESVVALPASSHPPLVSDITIFAVVCQQPQNDGYVVGKGINDRIRDFGLYLRSSKRTIWLAYGAEGPTEGFREILFFYNVSVADGDCHSIGAVVDSSANKAVLYIDGEAVGLRAPLPSTPEFRPQHNILYVGGRPSTRLFRFQGSISNLFVSSGALAEDNIVTLHKQAFFGGRINTISFSDTSVRYCYRYQSTFDSCYVNSFDANDFRCEAPSVCVPTLSNSVPVSLPVAGVTNPNPILGRCVSPCQCDFNDISLECGTDGRTYLNSCFRTCVNAPLLHTGPCREYTELIS